MRQILCTAFVAACSWLAVMAGSVSAQTSCPEGRTAAGNCVNPGRAQSARKSTVLATQPKLSYTQQPILPAEDRRHYQWRDKREMLYLFTFPQVNDVTAVRPIPAP